MTNSFSASFAAYWSRRMQATNYRQAVYIPIVSMEEQDTLKKGNTVHRPYRSTLYPRSYMRGTAVTIRDLTDTDESLVVDTAQVVPFYVDDLDALQHNYKVLNEYADDATTVLTNYIDGIILGEVLNATSSVDDATINGGTAGNGFTLTTANIVRVFTEAKKKLKKQNVQPNDLFAAISPEFESVLMNFFANRETPLGDSTGMNGNIGKYMGFDLYVSNGLTFTAVLSMPTILVAGDTITINGVVFTARADGAAVAAGDFSIQASADLCRAQLVAAINNSSGYAATVGAVDDYFEVSAANRDLLIGITAVNDNAADTLTITAKGVGLMTVAEGATPADCVWTGAKQIQHQLFGKKGCIDLVIQKRPNVEIKDVPDKLGKNIIPWTLFGKKTFAEGAREMVDVKVRADAGQGSF
jgi:hypothetical protein